MQDTQTLAGALARFERVVAGPCIYRLSSLRIVFICFRYSYSYPKFELSVGSAGSKFFCSIVIKKETSKQTEEWYTARASARASRLSHIHHSASAVPCRKMHEVLAANLAPHYFSYATPSPTVVKWFRSNSLIIR
jgi:hypothetical protein